MVVGVLMVWPVQGRRWWTAVPAAAALPGRFREASGPRLEGGDGEGVEQVEEEQDAEKERWGWGKGWTARKPRKSRWEGGAAHVCRYVDTHGVAVTARGS